MKQFIVTLAVISMLLRLLAVSVSAAGTNEFGQVEIVSGMDEKSVFGDDGKADTYTSRVVLFDVEEYHTYPAYYIFTNNVNTTTVPLGVTSIKASQFCWSPGINQVVLHGGITSIDPKALDMTLYLTKIVYTGQETDTIKSTPFGVLFFYKQLLRWCSHSLNVMMLFYELVFSSSFLVCCVS